MAAQRDYERIVSCVPGPGSDISGEDFSFQECSCEGKCLDLENKLSCNCVSRGPSFSHDGRLREEHMKSSGAGPVFECSMSCTCDFSCPLRITARGGVSDLEIFQTDSKGFGARTAKPIAKGTFVVEYVGEVLRHAVAVERMGKMCEKDSCYLLVFVEHMPNGLVLRTFIDAEYKGNESRFINHSCEPNLVVVPVRGTSLLPKLCLFAARDISEGEEVCYHYGTDNPSFKQQKRVCQCGSPSCVGYLPFAATQ
jgi:SET domain-containing protein